MVFGILLTAAVLCIVIIAALLIILWAVPVTFTGRISLCQNAPTLLIAFCAKWGAISLHLNIPEESTVEFSLFGRTVRKTLPEKSQEEPAEKDVKKPVQKKDTEKKKKKKPFPDIIGIADAVLPQAGALLHKVSIDHLWASVRFGLGDAALTGEVYGFLMALRGILMTDGERVSLTAEAEFHDRVVEGEAEGAIRIAHPLSLVPPVIRMIRHPAVWKMVRNG